MNSNQNQKSLFSKWSEIKITFAAKKDQNQNQNRSYFDRENQTGHRLDMQNYWTATNMWYQVNPDYNVGILKQSTHLLNRSDFRGHS